jgi:hypothetical protein
MVYFPAKGLQNLVFSYPHLWDSFSCHPPSNSFLGWHSGPDLFDPVVGDSYPYFGFPCHDFRFLLGGGSGSQVEAWQAEVEISGK